MEWKCQKNCLECPLPKCVLVIKDEREDLDKLYKKQDSDRHKVYYKRNREVIAEKRKKYYDENKEQIQAKNKIRYQEHRDEMLSNAKAYYQKNKEWIKEKNARRKALRLKELEMANEPVHEDHNGQV